MHNYERNENRQVHQHNVMPYVVTGSQPILCIHSLRPDIIYGMGGNLHGGFKTGSCNCHTLIVLLVGMDSSQRIHRCRCTHTLNLNALRCMFVCTSNHHTCRCVQD